MISWFMVGSSHFTQYKYISDDKLGKVFKVAINYFETGTEPTSLEPDEQIIFLAFKTDIDKCRNSYDARCAGAKRARRKKETRKKDDAQDSDASLITSDIKGYQGLSRGKEKKREEVTTSSLLREEEVVTLSGDPVPALLPDGTPEEDKKVTIEEAIERWEVDTGCGLTGRCAEHGDES